MQPYAHAVKGFICDSEGRLLIIKQHPSDTHNPDTWEIPGGRLDVAEDPYAGLVREVSEETGLMVVVHEPLGVHHFTRQDGQCITLIVFRCSCDSKEIQLSEEHTAYEWTTLAEAKKKVHESFLPEIAVYERYYQGRESVE